MGTDSGSLSASCMWSNIGGSGIRTDVDLHVVTPDGEEISFENPTSSCGGKLDVDCQTDVDSPCENIVWTKAKPGEYKVFLVNYSQTNNAEGQTIPVKVGISSNGVAQPMRTVDLTSETGSKVLVISFQ